MAYVLLVNCFVLDHSVQLEQDIVVYLLWVMREMGRFVRRLILNFFLP